MNMAVWALRYMKLMKVIFYDATGNNFRIKVGGATTNTTSVYIIYIIYHIYEFIRMVRYAHIFTWYGFAIVIYTKYYVDLAG